MLELGGHAEPEMLAAGLGVLAGANGFRTRRFLVANLDHADERVRAAAVRAITDRTPSSSLLAHLLFHPREEVRRIAVQSVGHSLDDLALNDVTPDLLLTLLAYPATHAEVWDVLTRQTSLPLSMGLLRAMHRDGVVADDPARELVCKIRHDRLLHDLTHETAPVEPHDDTIGWLIELFWQVAAESPTSQSFFGLLTEWMTSPHPPEFLNNFASRWVRMAEQRGIHCAPAITLCVLGPVEDLEALMRCGFPRDLVRKSIGVLYQLGHRVVEADHEVLGRLLASPMCRRSSGQFDLWILGALMHRSGSEGWTILRSVVSDGQFVSSFWENPAESSKVFSYIGSGRHRDELIERIFAKRRRDPLGIAIVLSSLPTQSTTLIESLLPSEIVTVIGKLLELSSQDQWKLSANRVRAVAYGLAARLQTSRSGGVDETAKWLQAWLDRAPAESTPAEIAEFAIGVELLCELARSNELPAMIAGLVDRMTAVALNRLVETIPYCGGISYGFEMTLAMRLADHGDEGLRQWATDRIPRGGSPAGLPTKRVAPPRDESLRAWTDEEKARVVAASPDRLDATLEAIGVMARAEVVATLVARGEPSSPVERVAIIAAMLVCGDEMEPVINGLCRHVDHSDVTEDAITVRVRQWIPADEPVDRVTDRLGRLALA